MRRLTLLAGVALLLGGALLAWQLLTPPPPLDQAAQAAQLAAELRCPDCQSLSVAESRTAAADAIRREIAEGLAAGRTPDEIRQSYVDRYGRWILLQPEDPLIWLLPAAIVLVGVGAFVLWLRRPVARPSAAPAASEADRRRVRDELDALDG